MQLILLTAFLGGCANIENFDLNKSLPKFDFKNVLPELNLDQLFTYKAPKDTTAVEISINSFLKNNPLSVSFDGGNLNAIKQAALNSPEVLGAKQAVLNSEISKSFIGTQFNPNINTLFTPGISNFNPLQIGTLATLNFTKILFDGGKLSNQLSAAELSLASTQLSYLESLNQQLLKNSLSVINVNRFRKIDKIANERIFQLEVLSEQLKTMENVGAVDATTMVQSNRTIYTLYTQKAELEENLKTAEVNFAKLFGLTPKITLDDINLSSFTSVGLVENVDIDTVPLVNNEFILLKKSYKDLAAINAQKSYSVSLSGEIDGTFASTKKTLTPAVGLSVSKNLFDGGRLDKQIESAETQIKIQEHKLNSVIDETKLQIAQLNNQLSNYDNFTRLNEKNIFYAEKEIELLRSQVQIGRATVSDIIAAEARLFEFQLKAINLNTDHLISKLSLSALAGTFSKEFGID
jgi:adhesin transport system outer membrane protein